MIRLAPVALLAAAACSDNPATAHVIMDVSDVPPAYGRTPFPSDSLRDGDHLGMIAGLETMSAGQADLLQAHFAALDGYGLRPIIEFPIEGELDPATVPESTSALTDAIVVIDVLSGQVIPYDWRWDADRHEILGAPHDGSQLLEHHGYAAVVTTDVHDVHGAKLYTPNLDHLNHGPPAIWQDTADIYGQLSAMPELGKRIAGLAVFTTQHASDVLVAARGVLASAPAPTLAFADASLVFDTQQKLDALFGQAARDTTGDRAGLEIWGLDNPDGLAHDHIAVLAAGTTTIARFKRPNTSGYGPDSGTFQVDASGTPVVQAIDRIPITFILPKGPIPPNGFPVVIFGHGLGGSRIEGAYVAEALTSQGYAVVAIDMWGHGSRYDATDGENNFGIGKMAFTGDKTLKDGYGDNISQAAYIAFFENFLNIAAIRDSIRQSALDFSRVAMLVQSHPDLSALAGAYGGTAPTLDATKVAYLGQSFGTVVGTEVSAIEPSIGVFVLDVPGGGIVDQILPNSPEIGALAIPFAEEVYRPTGSLDRFHPLLGALQTILDGADPLTFAPHVLADRFPGIGPRNVVCIEVIDDEIMSNQGTVALARALGLGVLMPDLATPSGMSELTSPASANVGGQTGVLVQYAPATHGYNWSAQHGQIAYMHGFPFPGDNPFPKLATPVVVQEPIYETQAQVAQILATYFAGGAPVVASTKPPVAYW